MFKKVVDYAIGEWLADKYMKEIESEQECRQAAIIINQKHLKPAVRNMCLHSDYLWTYNKKLIPYTPTLIDL